MHGGRRRAFGSNELRLPPRGRGAAGQRRVEPGAGTVAREDIGRRHRRPREPAGQFGILEPNDSFRDFVPLERGHLFRMSSARPVFFICGAAQGPRFADSNGKSRSVVCEPRHRRRAVGPVRYPGHRRGSPSRRRGDAVSDYIVLAVGNSRLTAELVFYGVRRNDCLRPRDGRVRVGQSGQTDRYAVGVVPRIDALRGQKNGRVVCRHVQERGICGAADRRAK